jgi:hypothetical protein
MRGDQVLGVASLGFNVGGLLCWLGVGLGQSAFAHPHFSGRDLVIFLVMSLIPTGALCGIGFGIAGIVYARADGVRMMDARLAYLAAPVCLVLYGVATAWFFL